MNEDRKGDAPEALFRHCVTVYRMMMSESKPAITDEGDEIVLWEGSLTGLILGQCNLSTPYYTFITRRLKAMECIRMLKRGGGGGQSQWELMREPEYEVYEKVGAAYRPRNAGPIAQLTQQMHDLNRRVKVLEKTLENIIEEEQK